ncbi:MAG: hypothetical protein V1899_02305 [Planctomycetota bacterium]
MTILLYLKHCLVFTSRLLTMRALLICGICMLAAGGSLSQWLRLVEVSVAANSDAFARYQFVLFAACENRTPPVNREAPQSDTKKKNESKPPKLLKPLTDLWDIATATHFIVGAPMVAPVYVVVAPSRARIESIQIEYFSLAPPAHRPRGPPCQV